MMKIIRDLVNKALIELKLETVDFSVEHPKEESHGDYSVNVAMILWKEISNQKFSNSQIKSPRELAQEIVSQWSMVNGQWSKIIEKIEVAGAGFINFYLKTEFFLEATKKATEPGYGINDSGKGKLAIVEYS